MRLLVLFRAAAHAAALCVSLSPVCAAPPVTVAETADQITLDNGTATVVVSKARASIVSLKYRKPGADAPLELANTMYYSWSAGPRGATAPAGVGGVRQPDPEPVKIVKNTPDVAEVVMQAGPTRTFPFHVETHYVLPRGESGFYAWQTYSRTSNLPAAFVGEARFVIKGPTGAARVYTNHVVDAARMAPTNQSPVVRPVQDATFLLQDGTIYTKYDMSAFMENHVVHGMTGHNVGIWMVIPSNEYVNGGPLKQELTVHQGDTLLHMLQGAHFGSGVLEFAENEPWTKVYGPFLVYMNHGPDTPAMYADALRRANAERKKWPYSWVSSPNYPLERGTVLGQIDIAGKPVANALMVLAQPGGDWPLQGKGYEFWTRTDTGGKFSIPHVRPGTYTLYGVGANQFEQFSKNNVMVGGRAVNVGPLHWQPVTHGKTLWQIGIADRSTAEFKDGNNVRHYGNFLRYAQNFPNDVDYTVGKSSPTTDWNFAQWTWYRKTPFWAIHFDATPNTRGTATLTFGVAASNPAKGSANNVEVKVNGQAVGTLHLTKSGPAAYRSGGQDSLYRVEVLQFPASLLHANGANTITLGHTDAIPAPADGTPAPVGVVMWDAIRLEVAP